MHWVFRAAMVWRSVRNALVAATCTSEWRAYDSHAAHRTEMWIASPRCSSQPSSARHRPLPLYSRMRLHELHSNAPAAVVGMNKDLIDIQVSLALGLENCASSQVSQHPQRRQLLRPEIHQRRRSLHRARVEDAQPHMRHSRSCSLHQPKVATTPGLSAHRHKPPV